MQIFSIWDNLHEMSNFVFFLKNKKNISQCRLLKILPTVLSIKNHMSLNVRTPNFGHVHPTMIQISLHIYPVQSESSLCAFRIAKDAKFLDADN